MTLIVPQKRLHDGAPADCEPPNTMMKKSRGWMGEAFSMYPVYKKCVNLHVKTPNIRSGSGNPLNVTMTIFT